MMSVPDPEKWEATEGEIECAAFESDSEYGHGDDSGILRLTRLVARRRALEELRALKDNPSWVTYDEIDARIAAIEAEEL
jgi:hypothetical protein